MIFRIILALAFLGTLPLFAEDKGPADSYVAAPAPEREPRGIQAPEEPVNNGGGYQMPEQEDDRGDSSDSSYSSED